MRSFPYLLAVCCTLALFALGGCSSAGKTAPVRMTGVRETTEAWISDGSLARFSDTETLKHSRPGLHPDYEGWVDSAVAIRYGSVAPTDSGYEGEAEWTVEFLEPVAKLAASGRLNTFTKVRLRGMIEGKEMHGLARPGRAPWVPFSVGNNVLTDTGTPWMSLGELDQSGERFGIRVRLQSRTGKVFWHTSDWSDVALKKQVPSDTVLAVARSFAAVTETRHPEWKNIRLLNLSAQGKNSAFVQDGGRQRKAILGTLVHPFEVLEGAAAGGMAPARVRTRMGRQISAYDAAFVGRLEMDLQDGDATIGRATLNLISTFTQP